MNLVSKNFILIIFFFTSFIIKAQNMDNKKIDWTKVSKLENEGKTKDALNTVTEYLNLAKKNNDINQIIKSNLYIYKYKMTLEEESEWKIVQEIRQQINTAKGAEKALLHSILAELLHQYYNNNSWKFAERTKTAELQSDDFRNWDLQTLSENISEHYQASLQEKELLQKVNLEDINELLFTEKKSKTFRPTLYDLLAHRAIDFYNQDFADFAQPANAFSINDAQYFDDANKFIQLKISTEDTFSNTYLALLIFQDLLKFRIADKQNIEALADADMKRLEYIKEHFADKDEANVLYYNALNYTKEKYTKTPYGDEMHFFLAQFIHQNLSNEYLKNRIENKETFTAKNVMKICNDAVAYYPNSSGANNCVALSKSIQQKSINITTEKTWIPNEKHKALVSYKNVQKLYLKLIKIDYAEKDKIFELKDKETEETIIKRLNEKKSQKKWQQDLSNKIDYNEHKSEIIIPELPQGYYVLMSSTNSNFSIKEDKSAVAINPIFVTHIAYTHKQQDNLFEIYVMNRKNSAPLKNAQVNLFKREYDYNRRKYNYTKIQTLTTDENGYASKKIEIPTNNNYYNNYFQIEIKHNNEYLGAEQNHYLYHQNKYDPTPQKTIQLFTDRAIYRPTQIVYFKGIFTEYFNGENKILPNEKINVIFKDANYQEIAKQELTTNNYGSFSGSFTAPATGMLGNMVIETSYGSKSIQVEEYKRPKFEVLFDTIKTAYNLNDKVHISGTAISYAGATLDNATVKYSVVRVAHFPIWCWWSWRRPYMPKTSEKIIAVGNTTTDVNGKYSIDFEALPDLSLDKTLKPYFTYKINVDVTDINGETQSNETQVKVGYLAIDANMNIAEKWKIDSENKITITTNNLNGQPEPTDIEVKIYNLIEPKNPLKSKLCEKQDEFLISKTAHQNLFPYDVYDNEDNPINWQKNKLLYTYNFNTKNKNDIVFKPNELAVGTYLVEFSCKDKNNNPIQFSKTFTNTSFDKIVEYPKTFLNVEINKNTLQPKDTLVFKVASSLKNIYAIVEAKHQNNWIERKIILLNNQVQTFTIPIQEEHRGGIQIRAYTITENRFHSEYQFVNVPYPTKDLKIEFKTFRDKLLPGQKEKWQLKISGNDKDKVMAELLTTMYDASLDVFLPHNFNFYLHGKSSSNDLLSFSISDGFGITYPTIYYSKKWYEYGNFTTQGYDRLNLFDLYLGAPMYYFRHGNGKGMIMQKTMALESASMVAEEAPAPSAVKKEAPQKGIDEFSDKALDSTADKKEEKKKISPRTNLSELAFFFPQLQTDKEGNIVLEFTMPEALTKWKLLGFAHTQDLRTAQFEKEVITQKELMVVPNAPRFMRQGDTIQLSSKISNLSDRNLNGKVTLNLYDATNAKLVNADFKIVNATQDFSTIKGQNTAVFWNIIVPKNIDAVTYEIIAEADNLSDGEQNTIPVLTNRMMVTEALPLWISGKDTKKYTFKKLLNNKSNTLQHHALTLEMSSNPAWYAVQALPYMMEYPYECAEQLFTRYYANTLASYIANSNPKIKKVFDNWRNAKSEALLSNLEKNQELKNVLLEESPWVREAQNETEQKKRIALLFDLNKMAYEQKTALEKLEQLQSPNGGFMWFAGMPENRFITQHIIAGIGHLAKLNVINLKEDNRLSSIIDKALNYLDDRMKEDFDNIKKYNKDYLKSNHLSYFHIHYLYMRSFFLSNSINEQHKEAYNYFLAQAKQYWNSYNMYNKAMLSMILFRNKETKIANTIIESFRQNAINSEELGMYWKAVENGGWYWHEAPVETQALLIEAFSEITKEEKSIDEMKLWLLKQKQTTSWKSTKATAEACYALLLSGSNWIENNQIVEVKVNNKIVSPTQIEEGTGYYKTKWNANEIKPEMANVVLKKKDKGPAYGAMYWQYFEDLDKITNANTNLKLSKKYFIKENTAKGVVLKEITDKTPIKVGDLITVRLELSTDRNLEFVHLKDMRSAGTEPTNVLSQYKWQDGFGYYETTKDVATHFFIDWLSKGTYVFEYTLRASLVGNFSSGITQIECMYAPEFKAHSHGQRQSIKDK